MLCPHSLLPSFSCKILHFCLVPYIDTRLTLKNNFQKGLVVLYLLWRMQWAPTRWPSQLRKADMKWEPRFVWCVRSVGRFQTTLLQATTPPVTTRRTGVPISLLALVCKILFFTQGYAREPGKMYNVWKWVRIDIPIFQIIGAVSFSSPQWWWKNITSFYVNRPWIILL